jgi:hypothetical protein
MSSPQEGRYTKIGAIATVVTLVVGYMAWKYPTSSHPERVHPPEISGVPLNTDFNKPYSGDWSGTPTIPSPTSDPSQTDFDSNSDATSDGSTTKPEDGGKGKGDDPGGSPDLKKSLQACEAPETANLRPGVQAKVASGLAVLSVKMAHEGSEPYLTLGIASDHDTFAEAVLGAPVRLHFKTSRGSYFVNVTDADLTAGTMTVQVGCETKENTP